MQQKNIIKFIKFNLQDNGQHLVAVDDANEHNLSVWDWDNKKKIAEAKVQYKHFDLCVMYQITWALHVGQ